MKRSLVLSAVLLLSSLAFSATQTLLVVPPALISGQTTSSDFVIPANLAFDELSVTVNLTTADKADSTKGFAVQIMVKTGQPAPNDYIEGFGFTWHGPSRDKFGNPNNDDPSMGVPLQFLKGQTIHYVVTPDSPMTMGFTLEAVTVPKANQTK
jgi:hypothetical protein